MQIINLVSGFQVGFSVTVKTIQKVLAATGVNLAMPFVPDASGQPLLMRLHHDPALVSQILWHLVAENAKGALTEDAFYESLQGEAFTQSQSKFIQELTDFFRRLNQAHTVEGMETMTTIFPLILQAALEQIKNTIRSTPFTSGPASSVSTPEN